MRNLTLSCLALSLAGCAGSSDLDDPEHVRAWANSSSALAVFLPAHDPIAIAEGERALADPACPTLEDDGTTATIVGGCTDSEGMEWRGVGTVVRSSSGGYDVTLDGYGRAEESPNGVTGAITVLAPSEGMWTFDADYQQDGLLTLDVDYHGTIDGGFDGPTIWNGRGTVTRGGFTDASGTSDVETVDQRRDPACNNQSWSGMTTIEHGGRTLVITYDGATDCDDDASARYALDGEDRGAIGGISCAASPGPGAPGIALVALGALGLLAARRRPALVRK